MSAGPMQSNIFQPPIEVARASHVIGGEPKDSYSGLYRVPIGINADDPRLRPAKEFVRLDTNGNPLRDWDD